MIVRKMTASFGVLQNRTLELSPGLNIIEAPNEYGKTTWCAFLRAMLYGIDTAQRGRAGKKPDKVLYAPWSGSPMAGTMEITFGGKDITLSRSTRIPSAPMRVFSAVYSRSGQPVLDLTGENAGETLTGASLPVFERTAFILRREFRALERHVRIDVTVQHHGFARREPLPDLSRRIAPVAGEEQRHQIGIDRLDGPQFAAQETGDQIAENRRVETREMEVTARDAAPCEKLLQHADLGRLARSVQAFEYDEHR